MSAARLVRAHLETEWLPALGRVNTSTAMLGFTATARRPLSIRLPTREGDRVVGPPASHSLDSELNPSAERTTRLAAEPISGAVLPNGWEHTCGPVSASTGQPASPEDDARQASEFLDRAVTEHLPTTIDPDDGRIRSWDPTNNTFASYTPDGETMTLSKPTSPSYWERQPERPTTTMTRAPSADST